MKKLITIITSFLFTMLMCANVFAAGDEANIKLLSGFKKTGTVAGEVIPQNTQYAENVKNNIISKVNLPAGFKIELFAVVPDARHMAVSRNKATVWYSLDRNKKN